MAFESQTLQDIETWKRNYELPSTGKPENSPEKKIFDVISAFHDFCKKYSDEVYKLADKQPPDDTLDKAVEDVLATYWSPIAIAANQQLDAQDSALLNEGYAQLTVFQNNLNQRLKLKLEDHIVLYLEEEGGKAKRFPFGSTRLIGVPRTDAKNHDWMAIPHELGHHLYWNARFSKQDNNIVAAPGTNFMENEIKGAVARYATKITTANKDLQKILNDWTEEIFADVVGTRIAGMAFVNAAWGRVTKLVPSSNKEALFGSEGAHPMFYLLPYIRAFAGGVDPKSFVHWDQYKYLNEKTGGIDDFTKLTFVVDDNTYDYNRYISISVLRDYAITKFVAEIVERLGTLEIDELIKGSSPMAELKRYITSLKPDTIITDAEMLAMLFTPVILEKNEYWICWRGDRVKGSKKVCPECGARRWPWSPVVR